MFVFQFYFLIFDVAPKVSDQLQEDLAKFDYETNREVGNIRNPGLFWLPAKINYAYAKQKLKICQMFVQKIW